MPALSSLPSRSRLLLALLLPLATFAVQWALWDVIRPYVWFLFYPTVFVAPLIGGLLGGVAATLLSALLVWYFFIPLQYSWVLENPASIFSIAIFVVMGGVFSLFHERLRQLGRLREQAGQLAFRQAVLDSIDAEIAVLDRAGTVVAVNDRWQQFAAGGTSRAGLAAALCLGANGLAACREAVPALGNEAAAVAEGVADVLAGRVQEFAREYSPAAADDAPWFSLTAEPLRWDGGGVVLVHREITAQRRAEASLHDSERRFHELFAVAPLPLCVVSPAGEFRNANARFLSTFGYSPAEIPTIDRWWLLAYPDPAYRATVIARWNAAVAAAAASGGDVAAHEYDVTCKGGEVRRMVISGIILQDGLLAAFFDVTALRAAEGELRDKQWQLQLFLEHAPAALAMLDRDMRYLFVSQRWLLDYRLSPEDVIGRSHYEIFPEIPERWRTVHRRCLAGATERSEAEPFPRNDGRTDWLRWEIRPWHTADGAVGGIVIMSELITEQYESRLTLAKLSLAVEQSPESIVITDVEGRIEYVNDAFVHTTGYSRAEVVGRNPRILSSGRTDPEAYRQLWDSITHGRTWRGEFSNVRKDGSEYVEYAIVSPIRQDDGTITHYLAIKQDITGKKQVEAELEGYRQHLEELVEERTSQITQLNGELARRAAEAMAATQAKSAFLANMSHEIRTPMNAILGMAHLMRRGEVTERQARQLATIDQAAQHLLGIINDVLDLSKIEAGKLLLEEAPVAVEALAHNVLSMLAERARDKGLALVLERHPVPLGLRGDAMRLTQALLNLANNAVKFTERGGVTLRVLTLEDGAEQAVVRFEVADTGVGIAPEVLPRLFSKFEQADTSTTRHFGGTGLGLAITRKLARLMGGDAGVSSTLGEGSTFWFTARLRKDQVAGRPADGPAGPADGAEVVLRRDYPGARILLVEDDPVNRMVAEELLADIDARVDVAGNGREAVTKVRDGAFDLVLMDMQMPEMDGLEATREIRREVDAATLPILAMTANAFAEDRARCAAAGMNDFVAKPVNPEQLFATILRWLQRRQR